MSKLNIHVQPKRRSDSIPAEIFKVGGTALTSKLLTLVQIIWEKESVPQDFKDASIIHLYKRKGNRQACNNHCGISLLSIAGKIVAKVLLNRLNNHLQQGLLPESQCGFRKDRGTIDMVFAARQLQEKCQERNTDLYSTFVDLTSIVRQFHDSMLARVQDNEETEAFPVMNRVKCN